MELLGHRNIQNIMIYMHLAKFEYKEYETAYAATLKEEDELLKAGFDFIRFKEKEQLAVYTTEIVRLKTCLIVLKQSNLF